MINAIKLFFYEFTKTLNHTYFEPNEVYSFFIQGRMQSTKPLLVIYKFNL